MMTTMNKPSWPRRLLVIGVTAVLVPLLLAGGSWLATHPVPGDLLQPALLLAGVGALALGARRKG